MGGVGGGWRKRERRASGGPRTWAARYRPVEPRRCPRRRWRHKPGRARPSKPGGVGAGPGGATFPKFGATPPPPPPATRFPTAPGERGPGWPRRWWTCPATQAAPLRRALSPRSPWPLFPALREPEGGQLSTPRPPPPPFAPTSTLAHRTGGTAASKSGEKRQKKDPNHPEKKIIITIIIKAQVGGHGVPLADFL